MPTSTNVNGLPSSAAPTLSIYLRQKANLISMLQSCAMTTDPFEDNGDIWKILIYDRETRDIVAPILSVTELRKNGVTLHLQIDSQRYAIQDVPAIYFIQPSEENVKLIMNDVTNQKYASFWINFTESCPRDILELLANQLSKLSRNSLQASSKENQLSSISPMSPLNKIGRIWDMYNMFHSLEHNLFSLNLKSTYAKLNAVNVSNSQVEAIMKEIVQRLFYVCITLKVVPVIKAQKGGPAQLAASMLDDKIREHLKLSNNTFIDDESVYSSMNSKSTSDSSFQAATSNRPVLVIVDRSIDISTMLSHTWTYQALTHDVLGLNLNRTSIPDKDSRDVEQKTDDMNGNMNKPSKPVSRKTFDLNTQDTFWVEHAGSPFPMVAEAVEASLQQYKDEVAQLSKKTNVNDYLDTEDDNTAANSLAKVIANIPELTKQKKMIDLHTNIATALLDEIKERGLDGYYQVEEELFNHGSTSFNVEKILAILNSDRGTYNDKLRLFLIYYLTCIDSIDEQDISKCISILSTLNNNEPIRAFKYLQNIQNFHKSISNTNVMTSHSSRSNSSNNLAANSVNNFFTAASVLDTLSQVANNVNKLIISNDNALPLAKHVLNLMDSGNYVDSNKKDNIDQTILDQYVMLDPKSPKNSVNSSKSIHQFNEALVFVVGPGNYIEFQNCQDYVCHRVVQDNDGKSKVVSNGKTVIYGSTELCTGEEFLEQLHANGGSTSPPTTSQP